MAVGSRFAQYINPLLTVLANLGGSAKPAEAKAAVANLLQLPDEVREECIDSGSSRFDNQVGWARFYLARADYIDSSRRGVWALTEKGRGAGGSLGRAGDGTRPVRDSQMGQTRRQYPADRRR